jgi:two-component system response regulator RegA
VDAPRDRPPRLLVVDDDRVFRERLMAAFVSRGVECFCAPDAATAYEMAARRSPDWVLLDLRMPEISGLEAIPTLRSRLPDARIVVLTGFGSIATAVEAVRRGATDYLTKPTDADRILAAFRRDPSAAVAPGIAASDPPSLDRVEWEHIQRVLAECGGNVSRAARALGMHRRSLQRKLNRYAPQR